MSYELSIKGDNGRELILRGVEVGWEWQAELRLPGMVAVGRVVERHSGTSLQLGTYFQTLADNWRGWTGSRDWEGLGLRLAATHDGLGHVTLEIRLEENYADVSAWDLTGRVIVNAGLLDRVARDAARFDRETSGVG
jgi:hypothetical protein